MFYAEVKRKKRLPFIPSEVPNEELAKDLIKAEKGEGVITYKNKEDLFKSLEKL
jgi:hypothetical protein